MIMEFLGRGKPRPSAVLGDLWIKSGLFIFLSAETEVFTRGLPMTFNGDIGCIRREEVPNIPEEEGRWCSDFSRSVKTIAQR